MVPEAEQCGETRDEPFTWAHPPRNNEILKAFRRAARRREQEQREAEKKRRVWFYRASALAGPWIGVPGCRPPIWFGSDEFDRRTIVFQLPGVGAAIISLWGDRKASQ